MATLPLLAAAPTTDWQTHGLCRTIDSSIFFPPAQFEHKPERETREKRAKAICGECPVKAECIDWALTTKEPHGVWGGYSESERKQILLGKAKVNAA
ncbi:WhiB family transcriptional regulator [Euzebya tangerina]|uniref:WhiB family transcriptional regulator n=1 Tax=Euzebya tangerina TaxID=591198 RepID=UPI000E30B82A|nr:WhiB family transcriptional regulator [Euzebya tangerina]